MARPSACKSPSVTREDLSSTITSNGRVEPISAGDGSRRISDFRRQSPRRRRPGRTSRAADFDAGCVRHASQLAQAQAELLTAQTNLQNAQSGRSAGRSSATRWRFAAGASRRREPGTHASIPRAAGCQAGRYSTRNWRRTKRRCRKRRPAVQVLEQKKKLLKNAPVWTPQATRFA